MGKKEVACKHKNFKVEQREETYPVLGEDTTIVANVKVCCDCGADIFDFQLDEDNLKRAFTKYKRNHALMTAEEICDLRKKYNISQRTLATLIGCSQATIVRYENGNIQDNTHNNIMRMLQKPENMAEMLEIKEEELTEKEVSSIRKALSDLNSSESKTSYMLENFSEYLYVQPNQYSGFREFDFGKYIEMIRYFATNLEGRLYKTKLFKLLWYSDMYYFREYTKSMSGMNYLHYKFGPVPREYSFLLGLMERIGAISIVDVSNQYSNSNAEVISASTDFVPSCTLLPEEKEILQNVLNQFGSMTAKEISEQSHQEKGYYETSEMELISYKYAMDMV
ncbi:type II TA system antitoxin MqsA family protein [Butyrivibrio sp. FCS006]|uniref:type II TA system antitoxin MqsA family protein n=1 Tax=Butyrivibrio sp. FCS006 TaxID=1280684 RepID=UPI0003FC0825|nr:type II TA system antitoxin MqsA family protein [Butyrivibrio sp. FCS006]